MKDSILMAIKSICDDIATNEDETAADENKSDAPAVNEKLPKPGEHFTYNGMKFVALGEEQGGLLAVAAAAFDEEMPYGTREDNNWKDSSLRKFLNGEFVKNFNKSDLLPFVSDLTSDDGMKDYGASEDYIALLSCDLYRKYRPYVPEYDTWVWTITPETCRQSSTPATGRWVRSVNRNGTLSNDHALNTGGVAPACIFNPEIFK